MKWLIMVFVVLGVQVLHAQHISCGTPPSNNIDFSYNKTDYAKAPLGVSKRRYKRALNGSYAVFTIQFYTVRNLEDPEWILNADIDDAVNRLNNHFSGAAVSFVRKANVYDVEHDKLVNFRINEGHETKLAYYRKGKKVIHVFIVDQINGTTISGYTYHPDKQLAEYQKNMIVLTRDAIKDGSTLSHEMGHFFGLLHTHEWFNTDKQELVSGRGCSQLGDGICDTPADPLLEGKVRNGVYVGLLHDPNGEAYQPMVENIMSYAPPEIKTTFTPGQHYRIKQYAHFRRQYLISNVTVEKGAMPLAADNQWTLAAAYESFKQGGPDVVFLMVGNDSCHWSHQMALELGALVSSEDSTHYQNYIQVAGSKVSLVYYDTGNNNQNINNFIPNDLFSQPGYYTDYRFRSFSLRLRRRITPLPALFILQFIAKDTPHCILLDYYPGYQKPDDIQQLLQLYPSTKKSPDTPSRRYLSK